MIGDTTQTLGVHDSLCASVCFLQSLMYPNVLKIPNMLEAGQSEAREALQPCPVGGIVLIGKIRCMERIPVALKAHGKHRLRLLLVAMAPHPSSDGLQPTSHGLQPRSVPSKSFLIQRVLCTNHNLSI